MADKVDAIIIDEAHHFRNIASDRSKKLFDIADRIAMLYRGRVHLDGTSATIADTWQLGHRIRAVTQGPDGSIWLLEDGAGARLLELVPA